ncbi:MAG: ABC transporter substrate-binding protein [Sulfuricurvum sp.]|jgi:iron complex transport system substrate-binding protein
MRVLLLFALLFELLSARVVVDDYGNSVEVGESVKRIVAASPQLTMSLLAFDPDLIAGINSPFFEDQKSFVGSAYDKPVVGGFMGEGNIINLEVLATLKPDVVLLWGGSSRAKEQKEMIESLGLSVLMVRNDKIDDLSNQFRLIGELSGDKTRADELIAYTKESLDLVKTLGKKLEDKKAIRYYFAQGVDGLSSECDGSFHLEPFNLSGAKNALDCKLSSNYGMEKISPEILLLSDPDVIVAMERSFVKNIANNSHFKSLRAVKEGRVFLVPSEPFNYISRPPSFMRLLGIRWLIASFYPEVYSFDAGSFEKLFFTQTGQ